MTAHTTLVDAATLLSQLGQPGWAIIDCRHELADTGYGQRAYAEAHIPGAHFLHVDEDLSSPRTGRNGRHPLPDAARLAQRLAHCGVTSGVQVVAYDDAGGMFAARLWWLLRWLGHDAVAVLDGGLQQWKNIGAPLSADVPLARDAAFEQRQGFAMVDAEFVAAHLSAPDLVLIDARSPDRYRGENEHLDPVGGHIPGAVNRFFRDNLDRTGCFRPAAELHADFTALLGTHAPADVVHQCGSGITACHNLLAMEVAGLSGSRLYPGSWSEWCADPARPVAQGA